MPCVCKKGSKEGVWEQNLGRNLPARELQAQGDLNVFAPLLFPLLSPTTAAILLLPWSMSFNKEYLIFGASIGQAYFTLSSELC